MITDRFQRVHDYLRISLTDSCNLRCAYCMPEDKSDFMSAGHLMSAEELLAISGKFVDLGVRKIRLTGGEPLVRKDVSKILEGLSALPVELTLTTNGILGDRYLDEIRKAGVRSLNISLDTLQPKRFFQITRRDNFDRVWKNILLFIENGLHVKLNVVAMKGVNEDELIHFVGLTKDLPVHVRFIEFMPFAGNHWDQAQVIQSAELLERIGTEFTIQKLPDAKHDTSRKFMVPGHLGTFAMISTMSEPFCFDCNRMRLTADGKMKNCLFSNGEVDLLTSFRKAQDIEPLIRHCMMGKHAERGGQFPQDFHQTKTENLHNRSMIEIGG